MAEFSAGGTALHHFWLFINTVLTTIVAASCLRFTEKAFCHEILSPPRYTSPMSLTCEMTSAVGVTSPTWIAEETHLPLLCGIDDSRYQR